MRNQLPVLLAVFMCGISCEGDTGPLKKDIQALQTENDQLRLGIEALTAKVSALEKESEAWGDSLAALDALLSVMQLDADGDVVIEGANLRVQSGAGWTPGGDPPTVASNGKGNLIIGYDEPLRLCNGGGRDGQSCDGGDCPDATCEAQPTDKSGSHNLIVGAGHSYSSYGSAVFGRDNNVGARETAVLGGLGNSTTSLGSSPGAHAVVVGGEHNVVGPGGAGVIVGGWNNSATHRNAVVVGGNANTTDALGAIVP